MASNYWSACRGRSDREFISRFGVAVDKAEESTLWLRIIEKAELADRAKTARVRREGDEITAILSKSYKTARDNRQRRLAARKKARRANS